MNLRISSGRLARLFLASAVVVPLLGAHVACAQLDDLQKRAVATFKSLSEKIKECPSEKEFGDDPDRSGVMYFQPPINVTWDVFPNRSARAPLAAYVEFATPRKFVITPKGAAHFDSKYVDDMTQAAWTQRHRYEFDVSASGIDLVKMLRFGKTDWIDEEPTHHCWQNLVREIARRQPASTEGQ